MDSLFVVSSHFKSLSVPNRIGEFRNPIAEYDDSFTLFDGEVELDMTVTENIIVHVVLLNVLFGELDEEFVLFS